MYQRILVCFVQWFLLISLLSACNNAPTTREKNMSWADLSAEKANKDRLQQLNTGDGKTKKQPKDLPSVNMGVPIRTSGLHITIESIEQKDMVGLGFGKEKSKEGSSFIGVRYSIKNSSNQPVRHSFIPDMKLVDTEGNIFVPNVDASAHYAAETGANDIRLTYGLEPGVTVKGSKVFEVPQAIDWRSNHYIIINNSYKVLLQ